MKKYLIVLTGPTGVGKTEVCLHLADFFKIPVINADSRQIFKEIPIGTAAPTPLQQSKAKHYFVGTHSIDDYYSASVYEEEAMRIIGEIHKTSDTKCMCKAFREQTTPGPCHCGLYVKEVQNG